MRPRIGFTLIELLVTVTLIGVLLALGATTLRRDETEKTRDGAFDVVNLFRRARYVAARQNAAVVVTVTPHGTAIGGSLTRGLVEARLGPTSLCPGATPAVDPFATVDFGSFSGTDTASAPGIARVVPSDLVDDGFCVRPSGRILNNTTGEPIRPAGEVGDEDLAGKARVWVQYRPIRVDGADELIVPRVRIEVPFNGLVRVPQ